MCFGRYTPQTGFFVKRDSDVKYSLQGGVWGMIVLIPDHCLHIYITTPKFKLYPFGTKFNFCV